MIRELKNSLLDWIFQWRGPVRGSILLVQRRVFILPTPYGLLFAGARSAAADLADFPLAADYDFSGYVFDRMTVEECRFNWKAFL